ncbi:sulfotransferase family protein [Roseobacter litoralis]|uniref:sulfotransferase family protein n=1 Tax=Roseobacter litoralis TaxID=42443 RepID=UPI002493344A|nr:sulfotransferase [Roseobacter litoralis]
MTSSTHKTPPLVLYGALRSGTTLMRLILHAHPDICCPGERDFMTDALRPVGNGLELDPGVLRESRIFLSSGLSMPQQTNGKDAFDSMLAEDRVRDEKPHHILVIHRRLENLLRLYPDIRIIHLVRDPRDVARSSIGMGWAGSTWFGIDHWIRTETNWDKNSAQLTEDQVFFLRYEDLLQTPTKTLTRLCAFVGVPYDPAMLTFSESSTYAPLDPKLSEQWRHKQTEGEVSDVEYKIGDMLTQRGYTPSGVNPRAPSLMRRLTLTMQDKVFVWRVRLKRFGLVDPVVGMVSRRIGLPSLGQSARARMREKQKKYLK